MVDVADLEGAGGFGFAAGAGGSGLGLRSGTGAFRVVFGSGLCFGAGLLVFGAILGYYDIEETPDREDQVEQS